MDSDAGDKNLECKRALEALLLPALYKLQQPVTQRVRGVEFV